MSFASYKTSNDIRSKYRVHISLCCGDRESLQSKFPVVFVAEESYNGPMQTMRLDR